jgi:hypothetical protein
MADKPDKRYDLSRYLVAALVNRPDTPMISTGDETETDSYMLAQSVMDIDPDAYDNQSEHDFIDHAQAVAADVIKLCSAGEHADKYLAPVSPTSDDEENKLTCAQGLYLIGLTHGLTPYRVLDMLKISRMCPAMWSRKGSTAYKESLRAIKEMQAEQAEALILENAVNNPSAGLDRMFVIKAFKPEYRDNAPLPSAPAVAISITIDGQPIDQSASRRIYEVDDSQE